MASNSSLTPFRLLWCHSINRVLDQNQIVLHEDKKYYQSAAEIYGKDVEALVQEEDAQPLTQPIIAPVKENLKFEHEKNLPVTYYNKEYVCRCFLVWPSVLSFCLVSQNLISIS